LFCVRIQARRWSPSLAQASSAPAAPAPSVVPGPASGTGRSALRRSPPPLLREERRSPNLETNPPELAHAVRSSHNEALCATAREFARRERNQAMSSSDPLRVGVGGSLGNFGWNPGLVRNPPCPPLVAHPLLSLSSLLHPPRGEKARNARAREGGERGLQGESAATWLPTTFRGCPNGDP
jgi:hypothetical protein